MKIAETTPRRALPELCLIADELVRLSTDTEPAREPLVGGQTELRPQRREFWVGD